MDYGATGDKWQCHCPSGQQRDWTSKGNGIVLYGLDALEKIIGEFYAYCNKMELTYYN